MGSVPRTKIISIEGLIASGKSTFLDILRSKCPDFLIIEEPVNLFQNYKTHNPLNELSRSPFATQCHIMRTLKNYYEALIEDISQHEIVIMERFYDSPLIFADALLENGNITFFEFELFVDMFDEIMKTIEFPIIDGVFYLPISPDECFKRMLIRNRPEEKDFVTHTYLENLERSFDSYFKKNREIVLWSTVYDTTEPDDMVSELKDFIKHVY